MSQPTIKFPISKNVEKVAFVHQNSYSVQSKKLKVEEEKVMKLSENRNLNDDDEEPAWKRRRREFWRCGSGGIWKRPIMKIWYVAIAILILYEIWHHFGEHGILYRHNSTEETLKKIDRNSILFPLHSLYKHASIKSGWRRDDLAVTVETTSASNTQLLSYTDYTYYDESYE